MRDSRMRRMTNIRWNDIGKETIALPMPSRSDCYKGLIDLLRQNGKGDSCEKERMIKIGEGLHLDRRFCRTAVAETLSKGRLDRKPVIFREKKAMEFFFRDALQLALIDRIIHPTGFLWLRRVARANGKSDQWMSAIAEEFLRQHCGHE
jgi:hypothetical protein